MHLRKFLMMRFFQFLADQSNLYAAFKNCKPSPNITANEMRCFISILIVSGYNKVPSKRSFWDSGADLRNQMVYEAMRRDRFDIIMRYLHCADNNDLDKQDKMAKLRPFMELLKLRFKNYFIPEREIDYDESMIEYFGRHGCKQFIRGKPIRFGYKAWCINTKSGYLINFEIYQGNIPGVKTGDQKLVGKASAPLLKFIAELSSEIRLLPFRFYFDNLFTSMSLLMYLDSCGYSATGTMRENRVPKNCPIKPVKSMKKEKRGVFEYATTKVDGSSVIITRWMDNSVVTVASTCHGVNPITSAKRYSVAEKKQIVIARPKNIAAYNNFMGGTDQMDANLNVYRIGVRGKKWWWPIFTWLVDVSIQNAWILQKSDGRNMSQLEFRRQIAQCWLTRYKNMPKHCGRPQSTGQSSARILPAIRYDRLDHFVEYVPNGKRRRCAGDNHKGSAVRTQCQKCGLGLCVDCFSSFHKQ
nr:unnamed protein product [Callosobruchus chinensis]